MSGQKLQQQTFNECLNWLGKFFNTQLSDGRRSFFWTRFQDEDEDLFVNVMMDDIPKSLTTFPTPEKITEFLSAARERAYNAEKLKELSNREPITDMPVRSRHAAGFKALLLRALNGPKEESTRRRLIEDMEAMESDFPGYGWDESAEWLRKYYEARKI